MKLPSDGRFNVSADLLDLLLLSCCSSESLVSFTHMTIDTIPVDGLPVQQELGIVLDEEPAARTPVTTTTSEAALLLTLVN